MWLVTLVCLVNLIDLSFGQLECLETTQGINYLGKLSISVGGECELWSVAQGNVNYNLDNQFPDGTVAKAQNYCRNPQGTGTVPYENSPWCWLKNDSRLFRPCIIPLCTDLGVCRATYLGETYTGTVSTTVFNNPCISWSSVNATTNQFTTWPIAGETILTAGSKCRNPNKSVYGLWCYTKLSPVTWEPCMTAICQSTLACANNTVPFSFKTLTNNEQYMQTCAAWSSIPITHYEKLSNFPANNSLTPTTVNPFFNPALMPDLTLAEAQNYCRNPDSDPTGAWCYVQSGTSFIKKYCKTPCTGIWACLYDRVGALYQGTIAVTEKGETCQRWDTASPNPSAFPASSFPDGSVTTASNYCRNPNGDPGGPWCYRASTVGPPNFGYCQLPTCLQTPPIPPLKTSTSTSLCQASATGVEYTGTISTTVSGKTCQPWSVTTPQANPYFNRPILFNTATMAEVSNFCRNPNRLLTGPWCYTTDPGTYTESCNIPKCNPGPTQNCRLTLAGTEYTGNISTTAFGEQCLYWTSVANLPYNNSHFADGFISSAMNYCRNPNVPDWLGCFCFVNTTADVTVRSPCVVPICSTSLCRDTTDGYLYTGTQATTISGKACLTWKSQLPAINPDMLPDATIDAASNYCRNPRKVVFTDGPFCYYNNSGTLDKETCGITYCTTQCRNSLLGTDYAGIVSRSISLIACRAWSDAYNVNFRDPTALNAKTLNEASNYCRNPDKDPKGLWCYTSPANKQYCYVPPCTNSGNCYTANNAWLYKGTVKVTENNLQCATWTTPPIELPGPIFSESLLPEPIAQSVNYCRAPTANASYQIKPWCYLDMLTLPQDLVPTVNFGFCNVTMCLTTTSSSTTTTAITTTATKTTSTTTVLPTLIQSACYTPQNITSYNGYNNVTVSGSPCLSWASMNLTVLGQTSGPIFNPTLFPNGQSAAQANNYCRVPTNQSLYNTQPWCYINSAIATKAEAAVGFGFCNVSFCNSTNSTQIFVNPAFNVFVSFAILISTLSLTHSALVFLDGVISTTNSTIIIQNRPLPDPGYASQEITPNAYAGEAAIPGAHNMDALSITPLNAANPANIGSGYDLIASRQYQLNAPANPYEMQVAAIKVVGSGHSQTEVTNFIAVPKKSSMISGPKVIGEGVDEVYSYNVSRNTTLPMGNANTIYQGSAEIYNDESAGGLRIIGYGSSGGYAGGSVAAASKGLNAAATGLGNSSLAAISDGGLMSEQSEAVGDGMNFKIIGQKSEGGYSGAGTAGGNGGFKIIAQGSEGGYSGAGAAGRDGGFKIIAQGSESGAMVPKGLSDNATNSGSGGLSSSAGGGFSISGGGGFSSSGGAGFSKSAGGGLSSSAEVAFSSSGVGGLIASASGRDGGLKSAGGSAFNVEGAMVNAQSSNMGSSRMGKSDSAQSKAIYYDINLNDENGSRLGRKYEVYSNTVKDGSGREISSIRELNDESSSNANSGKEPQIQGTQQVSNKSDTNREAENSKEDIYYSILDDWNPFGST